MSKAVCCLGIYAAITTIIIAILSWIISEDVACSQVNNVTGADNKIRSSTNYEFLNFDNRKSDEGDESCTCSSWGYLGIEAFEFLLIGAFIIFLVFKGFRKVCGNMTVEKLPYNSCIRKFRLSYREELLGQVLIVREKLL